MCNQKEPKQIDIYQTHSFSKVRLFGSKILVNHEVILQENWCHHRTWKYTHCQISTFHRFLQKHHHLQSFLLESRINWNSAGSESTPRLKISRLAVGRVKATTGVRAAVCRWDTFCWRWQMIAVPHKRVKPSRSFLVLQASCTWTCLTFTIRSRVHRECAPICDFVQSSFPEVWTSSLAHMTKIHCAHTSTGLPVIKKLPSSFRNHQWIDDEDTFQHPLQWGSPKSQTIIGAIHISQGILQINSWGSGSYCCIFIILDQPSQMHPSNQYLPMSLNLSSQCKPQALDFLFAAEEAMIYGIHPWMYDPISHD